jgi:DNA invertase Pin-like site-specific DNA recombinase
LRCSTADVCSIARQLYPHQQALDTSTPAGNAMFQMCGVFAEFERAMIIERVNAGLKRAKAAGKVLGRPRIDVDTEADIRAALAKGDKGILKIAGSVESGAVQRIKAEIATAAD